MVNGWLNKVVGLVVSEGSREAARGSGGAMEGYKEGCNGTGIWEDVQGQVFRGVTHLEERVYLDSYLERCVGLGIWE